MQPHGAINFTQVNWDFNKNRGRAESGGHYYTFPYLDAEDMELNSEDDCEVIKKKDKEMSSGKEPLSPIPEKLFKKYKVPSAKVN